ncbi:uncharacterized protein [Miscanthus floridulus]|uniref:uncharacterized protein n=1 Tax=Miscanthus floridulus TaxID=154761 RepID=UPI00345912C9
MSGTRKAVRAGGCTLQVRQDRQHLYIPAQLASSNRRWWNYGVPREDQPKLQPLLEGLERLWGRGLTAAVVVAAFHRRRVLPLMARRRCLFEMRPDEPNEGIRMSSFALSDEEILRWVGETVEAKLRGSNLTPFAMRPSRGFLSLGMRDVRASPPPVPEDARRQAANRAHAEAQKRRKDAKVARRTKKILTPFSDVTDS